LHSGHPGAVGTERHGDDRALSAFVGRGFGKIPEKENSSKHHEKWTLLRINHEIWSLILDQIRLRFHKIDARWQVATSILIKKEHYENPQ
jgi:hypothetical protein